MFKEGVESKEPATNVEVKQDLDYSHTFSFESSDWSAIGLTIVCLLALAFLLHQINSSAD